MLTVPWAAVIGSPIAHSLSPVIHRAAWECLGLAGDWEYRSAEVDRGGLGAFIAGLDPQCRGLSVTMPCKQAVMPLMDVVDPLAAAVGAVNTVVRATANCESGVARSSRPPTRPPGRVRS